MAAGRGTGKSPDIRGMWRCPSKAAGLWRLLAVLEGELFEEILDLPSPARGQPPANLWRSVRWSPTFLMSFASSSGSGSPGSHTDGDLCGQNPEGMHTQKGLVPVLLLGREASMASTALPHSSWEGCFMFWRRVWLPHWFCIFQEMPGQLEEEVRRPSRVTLSQSK